MASMRELKERIASVHSSQKITGAMKMIASARLRKAENKLFQAAPYRRKLWEIDAHIQRSGCDYRSPLEEERKAERVAIVVFASDEGLCGAFNLNLFKKLEEVIRGWRTAGVRELTVFPVGRKIQPEVNRLKDIRLVSPPAAFTEKDALKATSMLTKELMERFLSHEFDRIEVIYTHYKSMGVQINRSRQFLPVQLTEEEIPASGKEDAWYIYEPDCATILEALYPLMLRAMMYEMFIESRTSEQAARILAMQLANDNALKLLGKLQLEYNKLRQQNITTELLDIAGGGKT